MGNDNYPDDIRNYDSDPRSPFYNPPTCIECGMEDELNEEGVCEDCIISDTDS